MSEQGERRKDRRVAVDLWIEAEAGNELYFHRAANLSVGGAYFDKTVPEPLGKRVQLRMTLPGAGRDVQCCGEIVTAQDFAMGVKFLDLAEADRARIAAALAELEDRGR